MSQETTDSPKAADTSAYPDPRDEDGEEQKNRLGYMATEPTEEEIEDDGTEAEDRPESESAEGGEAKYE